MAETRLKPNRVGDPIIFRPQPKGIEHVVTPCSGQHRAYWLSGYVVLSCSKCKIARLDGQPIPTRKSHKACLTERSE